MWAEEGARSRRPRLLLDEAIARLRECWQRESWWDTLYDDYELNMNPRWIYGTITTTDYDMCGIIGSMGVHGTPNQMRAAFITDSGSFR